MNSRVVNLTDKVFGKLTVKSFAGSKNNRSYWNCICECGNKIQIASNNLRLSKSNFCGKCTKLPVSEALARIIFRDYKHRAKYGQIDFNLTLDELKFLISGDCHYCGSEPLNTKTRNGKIFPYNGIDRINSSLGYVVDNVRSCCGTCNTMKLDYTEDEFRNHLSKIVKHWMGN